MSQTSRKKPKGTLALLTDERQNLIRPEVLEDLTEAEREQVFEEELDRFRPMHTAIRRAVEWQQTVRVSQAFQRHFTKRGKRGGKAKRVTCPKILARITELHSRWPEAKTRKLWDKLADPSGNEIWEEDGRLFEDVNKSLSYRSLERYVTRARKSIRS